MRLGKRQIALLKFATQDVPSFHDTKGLHILHQKGLMQVANWPGSMRYSEYRLTPAGLRALANIIEEEESK